MFQNAALRKYPRVVLAIAFFVMGCGSREKEIHAIANGVRGGIGGVMGHFAAEAESICGEMPEAETSIVPPLDKTCSRGCRCAPLSGADSDPQTTYDCSEWEGREWKLIKFSGWYDLGAAISPMVYFHHQASWRRTNQGCRLDFTVYGDLDEDGVYSTYTTWTEATPDGAGGHWPDESVLWE